MFPQYIKGQALKQRKGDTVLVMTVEDKGQENKMHVDGTMHMWAGKGAELSSSPAGQQQAAVCGNVLGRAELVWLTKYANSLYLNEQETATFGRLAQIKDY